MGFADGRLYSLPTKSAIELTEILIIAAIAETIFSVHTKDFCNTIDVQQRWTSDKQHTGTAD
jgi:hypothetical protein